LMNMCKLDHSYSLMMKILTIQYTNPGDDEDSSQSSEPTIHAS